MHVLHASCAPVQLEQLSDRLSTCMLVIQRYWIIQKKVKLDEDKTQAVVFAKQSVLAALTTDCQVASLVFIVEEFGITLDPALSMKQHMNSVCKPCFY